MVHEIASALSTRVDHASAAVTAADFDALGLATSAVAVTTPPPWTPPPPLPPPPSLPPP